MEILYEEGLNQNRNSLVKILKHKLQKEYQAEHIKMQNNQSMKQP